MKRTVTRLVASMAIAMFATVMGAFGADNIGYCVTNQNVNFTESMLSAGDAVFVFLDTANEFTFTTPNDVRAWVLAVGGGGAGGAGYGANTGRGQGGGGGGGGVVESNGVRLSSGTYTIGVGAGGTIRTNAGGNNGGDSYVTFASADKFRANGGGGGARGNNGVGSNGASGGGGSRKAGVDSDGGTAVSGQGNIGGKGCADGGGGGGGGAGEAGGDADTANVGGNGGNGAESSITGDVVAYGGGGGGGAAGASCALGGIGGGASGAGSSTVASSGEDGLGGGGGGGGSGAGTLRQGANGGSGVVIIRISKVYGAIPYPDVRDYEYTGQPIAVWAGDDECDVTGDALTQTSVGEYSFSAKPKDGATWADGSTAETNYTWRITKSSNYLRIVLEGWVEGSGTIPTPRDFCEYKVTDESDEPKVKFAATEAGPYTETMFSTPGLYWVTAEIAEKSDCYDGASAGPQKFRILGATESPMIDKSLKYFVPITVGDDLSATGKVTITVARTHDWVAEYNDGLDVRFCDLLGNVFPSKLETWNGNGSATFTVDVPPMKSGRTFYMCWGETTASTTVPTAGEPTAAEATVSVSIGATVSDPSLTLKNWIRDLYISGWREGDAQPVPTCLAKIGGGTVQYKYNTTGLTPNKPYDPMTPLAPGIYDMIAEIEAVVGEYSWAASEKVTFQVLRATESPLRSLAYYASITATGTISEPRCVTVTMPASLDYTTIFNDGSDVRFCDVSGNVLKSVRVGAWATDGSARFTVELPAFASSYTFFVCWGPVVGTSVPTVEAPTAPAGSVSLSAVGTVTRDKDRSPLVNHWVTEPVFPDEWTTEDSPTYTPGVPAYPSSGYDFKFICRNIMNGVVTVTNELPSAAGDYQLMAFVDSGDFGDGSGWAGITNAPHEVSITTHDPAISLTRLYGAEGRVLLMNDETASGFEIRNQSYSATNTTASTFWEHLKTIAPPNAIARQRNMSNETEHILWAPSTDGNKRLWTLKNCRQGNVFLRSDTTALLAANNFLPWGSDTAHDFDGNNSHTRHGAGQAVMMNTKEASIISSCYDDGIGTIYFDAVNSGSAVDKSFFTLKVWVATDCVTSEGVSLPDVAPIDEYVREFDEVPLPSDIVTTNANWRLIDVAPLKVENGVLVDAVDTVTKTNVVTLDVTHGASDNWFYRIVVPLDITRPARFKIERASDQGGEVDQVNYYLPIDNIVVSYPAMRASITTYGEGAYDKDLKGKDVVGMPAALTEAFPSPSSTNLFGRGKVSYVTNAGVINPATNDFITSARFHYRWRYLDQLFYHDGTTVTRDDRVFASARLSAAEGYLTTHPLDLPGLPGDIEYWYELVLAAPYYVFHDYSGIDAGVGNYSENITNFIGCADSSYRDLPSRGTNWFVRVREGESHFEKVELTVKDYSGDLVTTEHLGMELVGDHLWRGFVAITNKTMRDITFVVRGFNKQEDGATEYDFNEVEYRSVVSNINITVKPYTGNMGIVGEEVGYIASVEYLPNVASYLEFQFNDETKAIAVSHADYQDFNSWDMSRRNTADKYYTSLYETNSTGIAKTRYPASKSKNAIAGFAETPRSMDMWTEDFAYTGTQLPPAKGFLNTPFESAKTIKSGWDAAQGMWIPERWGIANTNDVTKARDFALQMEGCGKGSVTFNLTPAPNGLDTIIFDTRLAQFAEYNDIAWCWNNLSGTNYTFAAQACFDEDAKLRNFSGEGAISLFAGYIPYVGAYEYRVTVYNADQTEIGPTCCRHAIYKWKVQGTKLVAEPLLDIRGDEIGWSYGTGSVDDRIKKMALSKNSSAYSGIFISFSYDRLLRSVTITGGVTMEDSSGNNKEVRSANFKYQSKKFFQISYTDTEPVTTKGTYGVLSKNCPARIYYPRIHPDNPVPIPATDTTDFRGGKYWVGVVPVIADADHSVLGFASMFTDPSWALPPGRMEPFQEGSVWGFRASTNVTQTVKVDVLPLDSSSTGWTNLAEVVVDSFNFTRQEFAMRTTSPCQVRISAGGTADDARTDVVVDNITLTQWCGTNGTATDYADSSYGYWKDFYYLGSWISNRTERVGGTTKTERAAVLAPRRADSPTRPVGIRTPYLNGYGSIMFDYKDCGPGASLILQRLNISAGNMYSHISDAADDSQWTTVTNFTFTVGEHGTKTVYLGKRPPDYQGVMRIVIPQAKVREAYSHPEYDPNWGAVTITDIYCYDEPPFDNHSWWGWNFLTTGWKDGVNNAWAALDDHDAGGVGVLNHTLATSTLVTGDADDYVDNSPFVQSPTIGDRSIGEVSFRARRYDISSLVPSYVTIWGATNGMVQAKEDWFPVTNVEVTASTYRRYTVKCSGDEGYTAIRIGVAKVPGIRPENALAEADGAEIPDGNPVRAVIDEVVIRERVQPEVGFRLGFTLPFRVGLTDVTAVANIDSRDQQPLLNEQFGFQAEVEIRGLAEEVDLNHTPEVFLSYYPSESPWGFANWKDAAGAVLDIRLEPAEGTNLIFRSTSALPRTFAGPYQAEDEALGYRIVQYSLLLRYWDKGGDPHTHRIGSTEWATPSWYRGFEQPHTGFSPYTLLDTVSPGRAWINEVNYSDDNWKRDKQFIEVCFPAGCDMTGWRINRYNQYGTLNELAWLGLTMGVPSTKAATGGDPNFAFLALTDKTYSVEEGEPCTWNRDMSAFDPFDCYGLQLVRPSGVIEQQIVVQGTLGTSPWDVNKGGEIVVETLKERVGGDWEFVGADTNAAIKSVGAYRNAGVAADDWNNTMDMTPGRLNCPGNIPDGWFLPPGGTNVWLTLTTVGGLAWIVDGAALTNAMVVVVPQGVGTNIYFETAPWHALTLMRDRTNDVSAAAVRAAGAGTGAANRWTYAFRENDANGVSLTASGTPDDSVFARGGLDPDDIYVPAIMRWLVEGTANGRAFEGDEISTNCFYQGISASDERVPLSLKDRYWLDIDPTSDRWDLRGGMGEFGPSSVPVAGEVRRYRTDYWPLPLTNRVYTVSMMISNKWDHALSRAPNRLQGLGGEKSDVVGARAWTSETFKITMSLIKGSYSEESIDVSDKYWPMAQFVFDANSFGAPDGPHPFAARIEVRDPMSSGSPAYSLGWGKFPGSSYGYGWDLSHGLYLQGPDMLNSTNTWDKTWEANHNDY